MALPKTPKLTVDILIRLVDRVGYPLVFIERQNPPQGWALPGGFVDIGETVEQAAIREAREETGLEVILLELLGCYSAPDRDPRFHTVSLVFVANTTGVPTAADDACAIMVASADEPPPLVFDHQDIVDDYRRITGTGRWQPDV